MLRNTMKTAGSSPLYSQRGASVTAELKYLS